MIATRIEREEGTKISDGPAAVTLALMRESDGLLLWTRRYVAESGQ